MEQAAVFKSNQSQAVRLPKAAAFPEEVKRVDVVVMGRTRIMAPAGEIWNSWFDGDGVSPDFMTDREQPEQQVRSSL
ncbi:MAG: antitoxin [Marinospirillum sp.]|uniref:type II toxin-antitoxin system VapB family antitoxin n=1 Tax=Marinospirillum sp. TaxID=2183934 RepID=UPI0019EDAD4D|nr:type II toxin-antitoxin system VapB family antitoxin [Marinospirillum sp.]MBE0506827.1 antitoxin [Marinospirillum sp.]